MANKSATASTTQEAALPRGTVRLEGRKLIMEFDVETELKNLPDSKQGKTKLVVNTGGPQITPIMIGDKQLCINVLAYVKKE